MLQKYQIQTLKLKVSAFSNTLPDDLSGDIFIEIFLKIVIFGSRRSICNKKSQKYHSRALCCIILYNDNINVSIGLKDIFVLKSIFADFSK